MRRAAFNFRPHETVFHWHISHYNVCSRLTTKHCSTSCMSDVQTTETQPYICTHITRQQSTIFQKPIWVTLECAKNCIKTIFVRFRLSIILQMGCFRASNSTSSTWHSTDMHCWLWEQDAKHLLAIYLTCSLRKSAACSLLCSETLMCM